MSLQCRPHMEPSGVPCIRPPMPPGQRRLRLPVMTVNGARPDAKGNVEVDLSGIDELNGKVARLGGALSEENLRAVGAENALSGRIAAETSRAQSVERGLRDDVSSAQTAIADRYTKRETDEKIAAATPSDYDSVKGRVAAVEAKTPAQASAQNQLADKAFVNSSIATNTAFYISDRGRPFQSLADLENYEGALTNNDYAFVVGRDAAGNTTYTRYKWNEATEAWGEEYVLNNSSFTAEQWAAINSGITSGAVAQLVHKRDYTDRSYNTQVTVNAPALHAILTLRGTQTLEYYLPCTKDIPATPEINHSYIWCRDGAEFYITQDVSALTTIWTLLYSSTGQYLASTTTDNATQGYFPDLTFEISRDTAVTSTKVNSYPDEVQDALALLQDLAPAFSTSATYALTAICIYERKLYRCTTAVTTAGAWTGSTNWTAATVEDVLAALRTGKANRAANPTAGNLAALDAQGNPVDAGYHFEIRNGIPCIVQYT